MSAHMRRQPLSTQQITHSNHNRLQRKMEEKRKGRQVTDPAWIIRWIDPYGLECKTGSREEIEAYAEEKARKTGNTYLIL